jgi:hypothetical protein
MEFRNEIITATKCRIEAELESHRINAEIVISHPLGNASSDIMGAFNKELEEMAQCEAKLLTINRYFK